MKKNEVGSEMSQLFRGAAIVAALLAATAANAQKKYGQGVTDAEIRIGQTMPYSGPASAYGILGRAQSAYFQMVNDRGGINGRKIKLISLDDGFSPPKAVEATRRLVEDEGVLFTFSSVGTAAQSAVQKYLNARKVPQLFLATGASKFNDPTRFPLTTPILPLYSTEGEVYARYLLATKPDAKVGILMQNDDFGRDFVTGFKKVLGDKAAAMIVREAIFEVADPTVDSQILALKASGADVLFNASLGKQTAQSLKKLVEIGWKPMHIVVSTSVSRPVIEAAGLENAKGVITARSTKQAGSPAFANDPDIKTYKAFMQKYMPNEDPTNEIGFSGYAWAVVMEQLIAACGDELTAENITRKATTMKNVVSPGLLSGITYNTTPSDYAPIRKLRIQRFTGNEWESMQDVTLD